MAGFTFQTTPSVYSGPGTTAEIGAMLAARGLKKCAFITDKGILDLGLADGAMNSIVSAGLGIWVFADVVADPPEAMILQAACDAAAENVDCVVSVGGGSAMDTAKLVALLCNTDQPITEMYGVGMVTGTRLPLILAPTTAGTGSEVTPISIVTTGSSEKKGVVSPVLYPDAAVLDAALTLGLPAPVTAATGIDAMVHAIEAFTSKHKKNPVSDCLARQALELLGANIHTACHEPSNVEARSNMLLGSMLAGMAFANAPVAAVHALAYPLGGHFKVPHGLSNAMVLPYVLEYNMPEAEAMYGELAPIIFREAAHLEPIARPAAMVERFTTLAGELGLDVTLSSVGVSHNHLPILAEDAMKQTRLLVNNPREMTYEAALAIYEKAL